MTGQPLCSDEVLPLLALALTEKQLQLPSGRASPDGSMVALSIHDLRLFAAAAWGLRSFEEALEALGVAAECITYAPWPGCRGGVVGSKRVKSPGFGSGHTASETMQLVGELADSGVIFGRKLFGPERLGGEAAAAKKALIGNLSRAPDTAPRPGPPRLFPREPSQSAGCWVSWAAFANLWIWMRWGMSMADALIRHHVQIVILSALSALCGWFFLRSGGIKQATFCKLHFGYVAIHLCVFLYSVVAFEEYSLLEPFRCLGALSSTEL